MRLTDEVRKETGRYLQQLPYTDQLLALQRAMRKNLSVGTAYDDMPFPHRCCQESTRAVAIVTGLQEVAGISRYYGTGHALNYDSERGLWVDLTLSQFSRRFPKIGIFVHLPDLFERDEGMTFRQRETTLLGGESIAEAFNQANTHHSSQ